MKLPSLEELLQAGAHFGHHMSRWHPKMRPFIFTQRSGIHILNLEETQKCLEQALAYAKSLAARGGVLVFVGTKRQARQAVQDAALACDMPYVSGRWLGGTFTNFGQIKQVVKRYLSLKDQREKGELKRYTKKEQVWIGREIEDLEAKVGGISKMEKAPEAIFLLDLKTEKTAFEEAKAIGVKIIAICDSNVDPTEVDYPIPANDDAAKTLVLITNLIAGAVKEGKEEAKTILETQKANVPV